MKPFAYAYRALVALPSGELDTFPVHLDARGDLATSDVLVFIAIAQAEDGCEGAPIGYHVAGVAADGVTEVVGTGRTVLTTEWQGWREMAVAAMKRLADCPFYPDATLSSFVERMFRTGFAKGKTADSVGARVAEYLVKTQRVAHPTETSINAGWR